MAHIMEGKDHRHIHIYNTRTCGARFPPRVRAYHRACACCTRTPTHICVGVMVLGPYLAVLPPVLAAVPLMTVLMMLYHEHADHLSV